MRASLASLALAGLVAVLPVGGVAWAAHEPLQPLTQVAKHLDRGIAAVLAGKAPAEAFAPWKASAREGFADQLAAARQEQGLVSARSCYLEFELDYVRGDGLVYRLRTDLWVSPERATILDVSGSSLDGVSVPKGGIPLDASAEPLRPFAAAAEGLDTALELDGGRRLAFADPKAVHEVFGDAMPLERITEGIARARGKLQEAAGDLEGLEADRVLLRLQDVGFVAYDAAGRPVGLLDAGFSVAEDGSLAFELRGFKPVPKGEATAQEKAAVTVAFARAIQAAVEAWCALNGAPPTTLEAVTKPDPVTKAPPLLDKIPLDGWGRPFRYAVKQGRTFEIRSAGPDGALGTEDDIVAGWD